MVRRIISTSDDRVLVKTFVGTRARQLIIIKYFLIDINRLRNLIDWLSYPVLGWTLANQYLFEVAHLLGVGRIHSAPQILRFQTDEICV